MLNIRYIFNYYLFVIMIFFLCITYPSFPFKYSGFNSSAGSPLNPALPCSPGRPSVPGNPKSP